MARRVNVGWRVRRFGSKSRACAAKRKPSQPRVAGPIARGAVLARVTTPCIFNAKIRRGQERHVFCVGSRMNDFEHTTGEQWEFRCELSGAWRWCRRGEDGRIVATSAASFNSLRAAITDAAGSGFSYTSTALEC